MMIDYVDLVLELSVAPILVLGFLLFNSDPKPKLLRALKYGRGFAWLFLFNLKLHHKLFQHKIMQGEMFLTGYLSILTAWPLYKVRIYTSALTVVFGLLWCRRRLIDAKERLEIIRNAICSQIVFTLLSDNEIIIALQLGSLIWLLSAYAADHESDDNEVIMQSLIGDAKRGIGYALIIAVSFGGLLLVIIVGQACGL